jgi:hypothetical protein
MKLSNKVFVTALLAFVGMVRPMAYQDSTPINMTPLMPPAEWVPGRTATGTYILENNIDYFYDGRLRPQERKILAPVEKYDVRVTRMHHNEPYAGLPLYNQAIRANQNLYGSVALYNPATGHLNPTPPIFSTQYSPLYGSAFNPSITPTIGSKNIYNATPGIVSESKMVTGAVGTTNFPAAETYRSV